MSKKVVKTSADCKPFPKHSEIFNLGEIIYNSRLIPAFLLKACRNGSNLKANSAVKQVKIFDFSCLELHLKYMNTCFWCR